MPTAHYKITKAIALLRQHNQNEGEGSVTREAEHLLMEVRNSLPADGVNDNILRNKNEPWGEYHTRAKEIRDSRNAT